MRYSASHKRETHAKLVKLAGRALLGKGPEKLALTDLMRGAGLTHGGFYAHFRSKDALLAEALDGVFEESRKKFGKIMDGLPPRHALARYIDVYVSPAHRDDASRGCPVVALNSDLPRQSRKFRATFDRGMKLLLGELAGAIGDAGIPGDSEALAASVLSAMAGAVAVARAVSDRQLSVELLEAARDSIKARLGLNDATLSAKAIP
ncbi:MAG: TetR/AcrR family transcriptional regulator [Rhizomicrobium sp.]